MFDQILERLSSEIAQKIIEMTEAKISAGLAGRGAIHVSHAIAGTTPKRRGRPPKNAALAQPPAKAVKKSKIKRDMHCRVEGCKSRSKGPGFGYMCEEHMKLPKAEQRKAQDTYRVKHAGK
jgi:hypothetical protein